MATYTAKEVENLLGLCKEMVKVKWATLNRVPIDKDNVRELIEKAENDFPDELKNFDYAGNQDIKHFLFSSYMSSLRDYLDSPF